MNARLQELRRKARDCETGLIKELTSREATDVPDRFAGVVGELKAAAARETGRRMSLETQAAQQAESRGFDERLEALEDAAKEKRRALHSLAAPLAKRALQAMRRGELPQEEAFKPLLEKANQIAELRKRIDGAEEGDGFWGRGKARAEKLVNQGKLKVAQFKLHAGLKEEGKRVLKAGNEKDLRCERTEEELEKTALARAALREVREELESTKKQQSEFFKQAADKLGAETIEGTDDIERLRKAWETELDDLREARERLEGRLLGLALAPADSDFGLQLISTYRSVRGELDDLSRNAVGSLENVDWPAIQATLGESLSRCPCELNYLRGVEAYDGLVGKDNRKLGMEICERGVALCLPAAGTEPFVGIETDTLTSLELEDMQQIYEMRRGNVVADGLIGFVTGGVKGAVMRGASSMREREAPVDMPDLVLTLLRHSPTGAEQSIHLAVAFEDKEEIAAHLSRHLGERFRVIPKARSK